MNEEMQLRLLKHDLQQSTSANDEYLRHLIQAAEALMKREGIINDDSYDYYDTVIHYASFLFRKRAGNEFQMPKFLRRELNNLIFSQKAGV